MTTPRTHKAALRAKIAKIKADREVERSNVKHLYALAVDSGGARYPLVRADRAKNNLARADQDRLDQLFELLDEYLGDAP